MAVTLVGADNGGGNVLNINLALDPLAWPTVQAGDFALMWWTLQSTQTPTDPSGFDFEQSQTNSSGSTMSRFYSKICAGTESGNISLGASGINRMSAVLLVLRGAHVTAPLDTFNVRNETSAGTTHACPQVTTGYSDCVIVTAVCERATSGTNDWTAPSPGYTERSDSTTDATGSGGTITAVADDGLTSGRASGTAVTPPVWTSANSFSTTNVITWTVSVRPLDQAPRPYVSQYAVVRASSW